MSVRAHFGDFCLDAGPRQLHRADIELSLSPKAFDVLLLLIERSPDVVTKPEIIDKVWSDTNVTGASLTVVVGEIRKALGDLTKPHRFIRTAHRHGYAFCAELAPVATAGVPPDTPFWLTCAGVRHLLPVGELLIGRAAGLPVCLDHPSVSRLHARVIIHREGAAIEDLGSTNGTFVCDRRISTLTPIVQGDTVRFGEVTLTLGGASTPGTTPTERVVQEPGRKPSR